MTRPRTIAALLLAAAMMAGCSSGTSSPVHTLAAAATTTVSPTPSPAPTPPTKAQAGRIYLAAVAPGNKAISKLSAAIKSRNLKRIRAAAAVSAKANHHFLVVLSDTDWPANVQAHADKLSVSVASDQSALTDISKAKTLTAADDGWSAMSTDNSQAQLIRVKLGLGAVPAV